MNRARFIAAARLEFLAQVIHYNDEQPGLGRRFAAAVEDATARTLAFPLSGSSSQSGIRKVILKGFPFSVIYRPEQEGIVVFAVAHHKRRPFYWQGRTRVR